MIQRCDTLIQYVSLKQEIDSAIQRVLASGYYILGPEVEAFENEFAAYVGMKYGVGVGNATAGLMLALLSCDIIPGDEVITTAYSAIPTASAIAWAGAKPVFVDIDPDTYLINVRQAANAVTSRTKAIMPVHLFGNVVNVPGLRQLVGPDVPIIEDAAQAHGCLLDNVHAGVMGKLSVFSFYPTKNLGCYGDGGIVLTNDSRLNQKLRLLRMYGMTDKDHTVTFGVNTRLDEIQAAILRVKLKHLDGMNRKRRILADRYHHNLDPLKVTPQVQAKNVVPNFHVFAGRVKRGRDQLIQHCQENGVQTNVYYSLPLPFQKAHEHLGHSRGEFPHAEALSAEAIALPMYPELSGQVVDQVIQTINRFIPPCE